MLRKVFRIVFIFILFVSLLLASLFFLVRIPFVQHYALKEVSKALSDFTNHKITLASVSFRSFDEISLNGLIIKDNRKNDFIVIEKVSIDFDLSSLIRRNDIIKLDEVDLYRPKVNMYKYEKVNNLNIVEFIRTFKGENSSTGTGKKVRIKHITISQGEVDIRNFNKPINIGQLDLNHLIIKEIDLDVHEFYLFSQEIGFKINHFSFLEENSGLRVDEMVSRVKLDSTSLTFDKFNLRTPHSHIKDRIAFSFDDISDFGEFVNKVDIDLNLDKCEIHFNDIKKFIPQMLTLDKRFYITMNPKGRIDNFQVSNLQMSLGKSSIKGRLYLNGFPEFQETFADVILSDCKIIPQDLNGFVDKRTLSQLKRIGRINFNGELLGFLSDFVANGSFITKTGRVDSDINLKIGQGAFNDASYNGSIRLTNFDLGQVLNNPIIEYTYLYGNIKGKGLTLDNANFNLNGAVDSILINDYNFKNITLNGEFQRKYFKGNLEISDKNLRLDAEGTINLKAESESVTLNGHVEFLNFPELNITDQLKRISTDVEIKFKGNDLDNLNGYLKLGKINLEGNYNDLKLDSILLYSLKTGNRQNLSLFSNDVNVSLKGDFGIAELIEDGHAFLKGLESSLLHGSIQKDYPDKSNNYNVELSAEIANITPYLSLFTDKIKAYGAIEIDGVYRNDDIEMISVYSTVDSLIYHNVVFAENTMELNISRGGDNPDVLGVIFIGSERQRWENGFPSENIFFDVVWDKNIIDFSTQLRQDTLNNLVKVSGQSIINGDSVTTNLKFDELIFLGRSWKFSDNNSLVVIDGKDFFITDYLFYQDKESIQMDGHFSPREAELQFKARNFDLNQLSGFLPVDLNGRLNTTFGLTKDNGEWLAATETEIKDLQIDNLAIGNVTGKSTWDEIREGFNLEFTVINHDLKELEIGGYYYPYDSLNQLAIKINFNQTSLHSLEPMLKGIFSDLYGRADGSLSVNGMLSAPKMNGYLTLDSGSMSIDYLNTKYSFQGNLLVEEDNIALKEMFFYDQSGRQAELNGGILHDNFSDFKVDLRGDLENFQVLNTTSKDNDLFYGTGNLSGILEINGLFSDLEISVSAVTKRGTEIFIPVNSSAANRGPKDYIQFVNFDKPGKINQRIIPKFQGLKLDFQLEVTPEAYAEIIFDYKRGDIIRGRGRGNLNLSIDTNGDFNLFGDLLIENGGYNFTLQNIINKEFNIQPGSRISWSGDPYQGQLDIKADYSQSVSLYPLYGPLEPENQSPSVNRKYPSVVNLKLTGDMLSPDIDFDINIYDYPDRINLPNGSVELETIVAAFLNKLENNEQELKRQVFSLIILRRFSEENTFSVGTGSTLGNSVSEFISNQLSYWASQVDENLEVDINLAGLDEQAFNTFQLRLAYTFLDGRLRVVRGGGFTDVENSSLAGIIGDWSVEYLLTPDGRLKIKMFNRNNHAYGTENLVDGNSEKGFSFQYVKSFSEFSKIFSRAREKRKKTVTQ